MSLEPGPGRVHTAHTLQRRVWHVTGGLLVLAPYALGLLRRETYGLILACALLALVVVDLVRLCWPPANALFTRALGRLLLPRDLVGLNGTTYFLGGILLAVLLFPQPVAVAAALFLILGDLVAGIVGRAWGRTRPFPGGKSLEGSAACFLVCLAAGYPLVGWAAAGGAFAAAAVEFVALPLDDNLLIPPVAGAVLVWLA